MAYADWYDLNETVKLVPAELGFFGGFFPQNP